MKTPHTITLIYGEQERPKYDPVTGTYKPVEGTLKETPCFANYVTQERVFEQYGDRKHRVLVVRFNQEQKPFTEAVYNGKTYRPIEQIDAPIKGAVRLREVSDEH